MFTNAFCLLVAVIFFFSYDKVVEHSYLADSVWCFAPGYGAFVFAAWKATRAECLQKGWVNEQWLMLAPVGVIGAFAFRAMVPEGVSYYVWAMTGTYSVLIALMVPAGIWIEVAFGKAGRAVAIGAAMATLADALIGHFWLFGKGYYPDVAYLNFVVYFTSQALIQQLPLVFHRSLAATTKNE